MATTMVHRDGSVKAWAGLLAMLALLLAGCGDNWTIAPDAGDAATDSSPPDTAPPCTPEFGRSYVVDRLAIMPLGQGPDRNGDGQPDNALALLGLEANDGFVESIANGNTILLGDFARWPDPVPAGDVEVGFVFYEGLDADSPADPSDNVSGDGRFVMPPGNFDTECQPLSPWDQATLSGQDLTAASRRWTFTEPGIGTTEFVDTLMWVHFSDDYSRADYSLSAVWTVCGLSRGFFPGSTTGTMLDFLANVLQQQPDVDRDGDGLEQVIGDGTSILKCIDGDGTEILGRDCPCEPRMADGYSVAFEGSAVRATIVGLAPEGR
ncbi:MAG: hypothetical protein HY906_11435 [Deltaproteobacteria bacterium]|nr:hypothetical protein [Deltaproteobacteria bacterium]